MMRTTRGQSYLQKMIQCKKFTKNRVRQRGWHFQNLFRFLEGFGAASCDALQNYWKHQREGIGTKRRINALSVFSLVIRLIYIHHHHILSITHRNRATPVCHCASQALIFLLIIHILQIQLENSLMFLLIQLRSSGFCYNRINFAIQGR